jgi:hypothetical protein
LGFKAAPQSDHLLKLVYQFSIAACIRLHPLLTEGNGIQLYGGGNPQKFTDTGGNSITSNRLESNCTYSVLNRRSGGASPSPFYAHIQLAYIYGSRTVISYNVFAGTTRGGIFMDATSSNVTISNNTYQGVPYPITPAGGNDHARLGEPPVAIY